MKTDAEQFEEILSRSVTQVAARLADFRQQAGLSIQQIVDATDLSRSGIVKIEDGRASPSVRTVQLYLIACHRSLAEFFEPFAHNGNGQNGHSVKPKRRSREKARV